VIRAVTTAGSPQWIHKQTQQVVRPWPGLDPEA